MWLSSIVLGPKHAKNIDIYLRPLVGELNNLWKSIKYIYDAYTQSTFTLRELLLWTMTNYPSKYEFSCTILFQFL
jgi:hypothetical protein